ncbi:MAG: V-type ATP synthase subunit I [Eubacteriales bacterium]|jgi:V/A-type H+-transporting ATPase subunit I
MAIVTMRYMEAVAPRAKVKSLLRALAKLQCVELRKPEQEVEGFRVQTPDLDELNASRTMVTDAIELLSKRFPVKKGLLSQKPELSESELVDADYSTVLDAADRINGITRELRALDDSDRTAEDRRQGLLPWVQTDLAPDYTGTAYMEASALVLPASTKTDELRAALEPYAGELVEVGADRDQMRAWWFVYRADAEDAWKVLNSYGALRSSLRGDAPPSRMIEALDDEVKSREVRRAELNAELEKLSSFRQELERCADALSMELTRESLRAELVESRRCVAFTGWLPKEQEAAVAQALEAAGCAYEISDPSEGQDVPVAFKNNRFVQPFNFITELYGMPAYNSLIDPNPVMVPFFLLFFGMMMADVGYGLLVAAACGVLVWKVKPRGMFGNLMKVLFWGGLSMAFWGVMFGSYFGDVVKQFANGILGVDATIPAVLYDPMTQPFNVLILSFALGLIHIMFGMAVSAWRQIRRRQWFDAICDVGFWYAVFIGLILLVLGVSAGSYITLAGVAGIILFGGRRSPKLLGKAVGGLSQLYGITGYLSDILSYSRLLALGLSSAIVASVFNILATLFPGPVGIIIFIPVFLIGHVFNLGINILGAFVHSLRLQYIEFFGKFFEDGGRAFAPAVYKLKHHYLKP